MFASQLHTRSAAGAKTDEQVRVLMAFVEKLANSVDRQLTADEYETLFREWLQECSQGGVESLTRQHAESELSLLFYNLAKRENWSDENMSSTLITFVQKMFWKHQDHEVIGSIELKEEFSKFLETPQRFAVAPTELKISRARWRTKNLRLKI